MVCLRQEKLDEALSFVDQALAIRVTIFGNHHEDVAASHSILGTIMLQKDRVTEAENYFQLAYKAQVEILGSLHPEVAITVSNLGNIEKRRGNMRSACKYFESALQIRTNLYGDQHPLVESSLSNMGSTYYSLGEFDSARENFDKVLLIQTTRFGGHSHQRVQQTLGILEAIARRQGLFEDAKLYSSKLTDKQTKQLAKDLLTASEQWRAMKMIVLGNGQIGKTTFVRYLHQFLDPSVVCISMHESNFCLIIG